MCCAGRGNRSNIRAHLSAFSRIHIIGSFIAVTTAEKKTDAEDLFDGIAGKLSAARAEIARIIYGQDQVIDQTLITLLAGGHVLLVGVPGLAKTLLVETTSRALGLSSSRVQCTPDLMPADILGSEVLEEDSKGKRSFCFIPGPVFTQFFMADEINRASPRTQSALLQAMQEKEVSVSGKPHPLPQPFHVLATQNPIEQEGTYPLPEAQLDRFLMQIDVDYPDETSERAMVISTTSGAQIKAAAAMTPDDLLAAQALVRDMPIGDSVADAALKLVRSLRPGEGAHEKVQEFVTWAPGPRGAQGLVLAARAKALLDGRRAPVLEDVVSLAVPVLRHRMALNFRARSSGLDVPGLIREIAETL
ncbi:MAG: MoxR family ATPase [Alphaproteobacteria bacterium]|nr:MoxR family ATPase [Alphaproteobacteria bacterium]